MRTIELHRKPVPDAATGTSDHAAAPPQSGGRQCLIDHSMLYVLGFGIVGAIVANALVLIYFFS